MHTRILTAPTTSAVLKGVRNNALLPVLFDEFADWLSFIHADAVSVAAFICVCIAVVAFARGKRAFGRRLLASGCDLGASLLPAPLDLNLLSLLVGLARTSFAMLAALEIPKRQRSR